LHKIKTKMAKTLENGKYRKSVDLSEKHFKFIQKRAIDLGITPKELLETWICEVIETAKKWRVQKY